MKTQFVKLLPAFLLVGLILAEGCKKYPDGPSVSLRSRSERVANTWKPESVTMNDSDVTSLYNGYTETFTKDGGYSITVDSTTVEGHWAFQEKDTQIQLDSMSSQGPRTLNLLRLKEKELWYSFTENGDNYVYHLIPN